MRGTHPERALEIAVARSGALRRDEHVLVACSGGADSVGLAALLASVAKSMRLKLTLAHVNHGTRASAWQDEAVALRVSAALGIPIEIVALQPASQSEAALRDLRYAALRDAARSCGAGVVATGHHAQDQTETVLLALFRGSGATGLAGMPVRRALSDGVDLARPLLRLERDEIARYVVFAGLPYAVDPTNADESLRRNAVRAALQALRPQFPHLDAAVARAAQVLADELHGAPQAALRRQVRERLAEHDALEGVDFEHVAAAVRTLERGGSGEFHMAPGVRVAIENGRLTVHREVR